MAAGLLLIGIAGHQKSLPMLYAVLPISVVGFSALSPSLLALLSLRSPESEQGGILGVGQSMSAMARIAGPALGIPLYKLQMTYPYWGGAALMTIVLLFVFALRNPNSQSKNEPVAASTEA